MSHDGTTCCTSIPAGYLPTTSKVFGSITQTSPDLVCGTYTSGLAALVTSLSMFAAASEYTLCGSVTGGMPGSGSATGAAAAGGPGGAELPGAAAGAGGAGAAGSGPAPPQAASVSTRTTAPRWQTGRRGDRTLDTRRAGRANTARSVALRS